MDAVGGEAGGGEDARLDDLVRRFVDASRAQSTRKAYGGAWSRFEQFAAERGVPALPASQATVARFLALVGESSYSMARKARSALWAAHRDVGLDPPGDAPLVSLMMRGVQRIHGSEPQPADPLPVAAFVKFCKTPPPMSWRLWILRAAHTALGLRMMARGDEVVRVRLRHVVATSMPPFEGGLRVFIPTSKTMQLGPSRGQAVYIDPTGGPACPVALVRRAMSLRRSEGAGEDDFLFVTERGRVWAQADSSDSVRSVAEWSGLEGRYTGHSLRHGGATAAAAAGVGVAGLKAVGTWKSDPAALGYVNQVAAGRLSRNMGMS